MGRHFLGTGRQLLQSQPLAKQMKQMKQMKLGLGCSDEPDVFVQVTFVPCTGNRGILLCAADPLPLPLLAILLSYLTAQLSTLRQSLLLLDISEMSKRSLETPYTFRML